MRSRGGSFGGGGGSSWLSRTPLVVVVLLGITLGSSLVAALTSKVLPIFAYGALSPYLVWQGQVWRLVTWVFLQSDPIGLVFGCLSIYWFGGPLCRAWGGRRFLLMYLAVAVGAAVITTLIGHFLWADVNADAYLGMWPLAEALIVAYAILYPNQPILIAFVLPMQGQMLILATFAGITLYAVYYGFHFFLPHYLAATGMLVYLGGLRSLYLRWRLSRLTKERARPPGKVIPMRRRPDDDDDDGGGASPKPGGKRWLN